jgi:hypothetical protein
MDLIQLYSDGESDEEGPLTEEKEEISASISSSRKEWIFFPSLSPPLKIVIQEVLHEDYGFYVWPAALVLAEYLIKNAFQFVGKGVIEVHL